MQIGFMMIPLVLIAWPTEAREPAVDGDQRSRIERLLTLAAEPSAKNLQAAERYYRSLPAASRKNALLKYAYVVALIQQHRYNDASKLLHELGDEHPDDFVIWRNRIWLALTLGERTRALTDIEQLASHAHAHQTGDNEPLAEIEMAEFFGTVCGFLSGPWWQRVRRPDAQQIEDRLRGAFDDESRAAFDQAKAKVAQRYEELRSAHEQRAKEDLASRAKQLDDAKQSVGRAAQELGDKQQALKDKEAKRTADSKAKVADIDQDMAIIDGKRQALLQQIAPLEAQRLALVSQLLPEPLSFRARRDPLGVAHLNHNRPIRLMLAPLVAKLTSLEAELTALNQREQELFVERAATGVKYQADLGKLAQQEQALDKDRKRVKNNAKRLKAQPVANSPQLRAEADQLTRFSSYAPFPYEQEKDRLLELAAKNP